MNKAYEFCKDNVKKKTSPKYVKLQMRDFMQICEGKNKKYILSESKLKQLENILKILIMPKGLKAGQTLYDCTCGYQWLFYTAMLCVVYRDNPKKRRYETGVLEICRKNFKTYTIATIFILLFLTEPKFSKFFSVAPDGALSKEIKEAIGETIKSSPLIYEYKNAKDLKSCVIIYYSNQIKSHTFRFHIQQVEWTVDFQMLSLLTRLEHFRQIILLKQ